MANVRFVRTSKERYLSRDTYDSTALYFCEDTGEIFKGQVLFTQGIQVIPTKSSLPSFTCAADGVLYYVTDTKSGFKLSPDRTEWLQTIYAPVDDVTTIPEGEEYNVVTTVGAVRDIENAIYDYINREIANVQIAANEYVNETLANTSPTDLKAPNRGGTVSGYLDDTGNYSIPPMGYAFPEGTIDGRNGHLVVDAETGEERIPTTEEFLASLQKVATNGNIYLDKVLLSDFPDRIGNAEVKVEKVSGVLYATLYSANVEPHYWRAIYWTEIEQAWTADFNGDKYFTKEEIEILIPKNVSELNNDVGYVTQDDMGAAVDGLAAEEYVNTKIADAKAEVETRIDALENIDHEAYASADEQVLSEARGYADGLHEAIDARIDGVDGRVDEVERVAKDYTDRKAVELDNVIGILSNLATTDKTNIVSAINEVDDKLWSERAKDLLITILRAIVPEDQFTNVSLLELELRGVSEDLYALGKAQLGQLILGGAT